MLATMSADRESLSGHLARPTSFLIRDILGKEVGDSMEIDSEVAKAASDCGASPSSSLSAGSADESLSWPHHTPDSFERNQNRTPPLSDEVFPRDRESSILDKIRNELSFAGGNLASFKSAGNALHVAREIDHGRYERRRHRLHSRENCASFESCKASDEASMSSDAAERSARDALTTRAEKTRDHSRTSMRCSRLLDHLTSEQTEDVRSSGAEPTLSSSSAYERFRNSVLKTLEEDPYYSRNLSGGLVVNPMLDLPYIYALGAYGAIPLQQMPQQFWLTYANLNASNSNFENTYADYLERARQLAAQSALSATPPLQHSHQRYFLNDWLQDKDALISSASCNARSPRAGAEEERFSDLDQHASERCSEYPPSPSSSPSSLISPQSPQKPVVQLPAYLRNRLSGNSTSSEGGSVSSNGKPKKCRRSRTVFTELQMLGLEKRFEKQQYLSTPDRVELAELLGLSQLQVKTWYQNRRMKWKKQVLQGGGTEPPTKPKGRPRKIRPEEQSVPKLAASEYCRPNPHAAAAE